MISFPLAIEINDNVKGWTQHLEEYKLNKVKKDWELEFQLRQLQGIWEMG